MLMVSVTNFSYILIGCGRSPRLQPDVAEVRLEYRILWDPVLSAEGDAGKSDIRILNFKDAPNLLILTETVKKRESRAAVSKIPLGSSHCWSVILRVMN
jgi:hypothetical protein